FTKKCGIHRKTAHSAQSVELGSEKMCINMWLKNKGHLAADWRGYSRILFLSFTSKPYTGCGFAVPGVWI
ncbi:MAG: hypothetical protein AABY74_03560, partial [Planctomycetota bacterium]